MAVLRVPDDFPSISAAVTSARPGDTILVMNGVYREAVVVPTGKLAIRIIADGEKVILDGEGCLAIAFTVLSNKVEIKGFTIRNYVVSGIRVSTPEEPLFLVGSNLIGNNISHISQGNGIELMGTFATLVWRNRITGVRGSGIFTSSGISTANTQIVENEINGNRGHGVAENSVGSPKIGNRLIANKGDGIRDNIGFSLMKDNRFEANGGDGIRVNGVFNFFDQNGFAGIVSNKTAENRLSGIRLEAGQGIATGNRIVENKQTGILVDSDFNVIQENKVTGNQQSGILISRNAGGNLIIRNSLAGNVPIDIESIATDNDFVANNCNTSKPPGICRGSSSVFRVPGDFPTISAAVASNRVTPGDTILVANGVYHEAVVVPPAKQSIRIVAEGGRAILDGKGRLATAFTLQGNNVEIKGFTIINYVEAGIRATPTEELPPLFGTKLIGNSLFSITDGSGFELSDTFATLVWRNRVSGVARNGVTMQNNAMDTWVLENQFSGNGGSGIFTSEAQVWGSAFVRNLLLANAGHGVEDQAGPNLIMENLVVGNRKNGIYEVVSGTETDPLGIASIIDNVVSSNLGDGIKLERTQNLVAGNQVRQNSGSGVLVDSNFNVIQENQVTGNETSGVVVTSKAKGNLIIRNRLADNTPFDLVRLNPDNDLVQNKCGTSDPTGLCTTSKGGFVA